MKTRLRFPILALLIVCAGAVWASTIQYQTASSTVFNASVGSGPNYHVIQWYGFTDGSGTAIDAAAAGASVTITLSVPLTGVYDVQGSHEKARRSRDRATLDQRQQRWLFHGSIL